MGWLNIGVLFNVSRAETSGLSTISWLGIEPREVLAVGVFQANPSFPGYLARALLVYLPISVHHNLLGRYLETHSSNEHKSIQKMRAQKRRKL